MAARYTEITLEEMDRFFKRAFRAMRPKRDIDRDEYVYMLKLSKNVALRIYSSIMESGVGAGRGQDAIRLVLYGSRIRRPLVKGKAPIVKRTQGWRNSLHKQVETAIEKYDENETYWEERAGGPTPEEKQEARKKEGKPTISTGYLKVKPLVLSILEEVGNSGDTISLFRDKEDLSKVVVFAKESLDPYDLIKDLARAFSAKGIKPQAARGKALALDLKDVEGEPGAPSLSPQSNPPSDKQVNYAGKLLKRMGQGAWGAAEDLDWPRKYKSPTPPDEPKLRSMDKRDVSQLISDLINNGYGFQRYADDGFPDADQSM